MSSAEESAAFRREATDAFKLAVVGLVALAVALPLGGWWAFGWWGVLGGVVLSALELGVGLTMAGFVYAMTQDGG